MVYTPNLPKRYHRMNMAVRVDRLGYRESVQNRYPQNRRQVLEYLADGFQSRGSSGPLFRVWVDPAEKRTTCIIKMQ